MYQPDTFFYVDGDDGRGQCVNCRDNNDCPGNNGQCVNNVCQECNPNTTAGCAETSAEPTITPSAK